MSILRLHVWLVWLVPVVFETLDTSEEARGMPSIPQLNCAEAMLVFWMNFPISLIVIPRSQPLECKVGCLLD